MRVSLAAALFVGVVAVVFAVSYRREPPDCPALRSALSGLHRDRIKATDAAALRLIEARITVAHDTYLAKCGCD